jgi:hypothetical protein
MRPIGLRFPLSVLLVLTAFPFGVAHAAINATANLTTQQLGPNSYEYSITLNNTGDTNIGTYWFSWIPGYDFLTPSPTQVSSPAGWTGSIQQDGFIPGYYALEWTTNTPLAAGQSLSGFKFDTSEPPAVLTTTSYFSPYPISTSYVYIGASEGDPGRLFNTSVTVPEPTALAPVVLAAGLALKRCRRKSAER